MVRLAALEANLATQGRVVVAYSGGVDSSVLALIARRTLGVEGMRAVLGWSPAVGEDARAGARRVADRFDIPYQEIPTYELQDAAYAANPTDRCYFCKHELWARLEPVRRTLRFDTIVEGTHRDDLGEHRPGRRAGEEAQVLSPFLAVGWGKAEIRDAARRLGLPHWDAPSAPCLASRIRYGLPVTSARLAQVERGERFLRGLGIEGDLRVRHLGDTASVEVLPTQFERLQSAWNRVEEAFRDFGFAAVQRNPAGYRRGSLLPVLDAGGR